MLTIKSDDMVGRVQAFSALIQGNKIPGSTTPETFKLLVRQLNGLGLGLEAYSSEDGVVESDEENEKGSDNKTPGEGEIDTGEEGIIDKESLEDAGLEEVDDSDDSEEEN